MSRTGLPARRSLGRHRRQRSDIICTLIAFLSQPRARSGSLHCILTDIHALQTLLGTGLHPRPYLMRNRGTVTM
nr:MAG TPA_asm: hypothetical protein [Caudoviricetes sp.]